MPVVLLQSSGGARMQEGILSLMQMAKTCLLYTSDAADERSSVDLGGRRTIKKKKTSDLV